MIVEKPLMFLVIDDDTLSNQLVANQLQDLGHRVVGRAFNGPQGIELTQQLEPDVIVLDLQMKDLETKREDPQAGIKAARAIQAQCPTPVVVLTAYKSPELIREATDVGIGAYLLKPPDPQEIERAARIAVARFDDMQTAKRLKELLDASQAMAHVGSWELDLVTGQLTWSDEVYRIFGLSPQAFGATYEAFLDAVHPDDRAAVDAAYSDSLREGCDTYEIEHRVVRQGTGEVRIVQERCRHIRDVDGQVIRSIGMVQDITERARAAAEVRASHAEQIQDLNWLSQAALHLLSLSDTGAILDYAGRMIQGKVGDSLVVTLRTSPGGQKLQVEGIVGIDDTLLGETIRLIRFDPRGQALDIAPEFAEIYRQGRLFRHEGGVAEFAASVLPRPVGKAFAELLDIHHVYTVGLVGRERVLGNVHIFKRSPEPIEKPQLIESFARQVALSLEQAVANEALRESEKRYRLLVDNTSDYITHVDHTGRVVFASEVSDSLYGYTPDELIGTVSFERIHPDDRDRVMAVFRRMMESGEDARLEYRIRHKDGHYIWFETAGRAVYNRDAESSEAVLVSRDITQRKQIEQTLRVKEAALDTSINAIAMADLEASLTYVNDAFLKWWGYDDPEEVLGRPAVSFWQTEDAAAEVVAALREKGTWQGDLIAKKRDGTLFDAQLSASVVTRESDGQPICMMASFVDITERKRAEQKLEDYTERLREMVEEKVLELEEERAKAIQMDKLAALGEMATAVAHELHQPLAAIQFEADYLKMVGAKARTEHDDDLNAVVDGAALRKIGESVEGDLIRCRRLIDHLRDFGRISHEPPVPICLNDPIEDSFIIIGARLQNHDVDIDLDLAEDLPPIVAHTHRLEQVIINLISNAEHAMDQKAADQPDYRKTLEIATTCTDGEVIVRVSDNGCGIPKDVLPHIFDPFFTTKPRGEGTGLGLSISYRIVIDYGGEITCDSVEGEGTTVTLRFPVAEIDL